MISIQSLKKIVKDAQIRLANGNDVELVRQQLLGRKGELNRQLADLPKLAPSNRRQVGAFANQIKIELNKLLETKINPSKMSDIDLTLPVGLPPHGHEHPVQYLIAELYQILGRQGFSPFITPEIETETVNFDTLRVPFNHPARDMQDTFWTTDKMVLRTHTTTFQHATLSNFKPPFAVMQGGKIYRAEAEDATHLSEFHQFDFFAVDETLSFADLKGLLAHIISHLFSANTKTRLRPSYFPFVEPGAELDILCEHCFGHGCKACGQKGWLELLGCGVTHPEIIQAHGLDHLKYRGIACGIGIERLAMIKYGVEDIREFSKNDPRFLEQLI